jgi:hypothetical protein
MKTIKRSKYMDTLHLALIGLAKMLENQMSYFEKRKLRDFRVSDSEKIELFDKYAYTLFDRERVIYEENKNSVRFRIGWGEKRK